MDRMQSDGAPPAPSLYWEDENGATRALILTDRIFLGRVCRGIEKEKRILVRSPMVSRDHAVVRLTSRGIKITDLSKNGTWINDVRMAPGDSQPLADGDSITLGGVSIHLSCPHFSPFPDEEETWSEQTTVSAADVTITSLVADVRGFSSFSQTLDSAMVYTVIKTIFSRFSAIVNDHRGTVKDYAGDAVFAFWEHPGGGLSGDRALAACRAAVSQFNSVPQIHRQLRVSGLAIPPPPLGWGITTGPVTLSHFGSRAADLALVGDCINLAFRLSSMANKTLAGPIALCQQTANLVTGSLPLTDLGEHEIRGRSGHEHLFGIREASLS
jgi:class 3 adenylate cyclase